MASRAETHDAARAYYRLFGLTVASDRSCSFDHLEIEADISTIDVELRRNSDWTPDEFGIYREGRLSLAYGGWRFELKPETRRLAYTSHTSSELDLPLEHVLERLALPVYATLYHSNHIGLHAGGVVLGGSAWLFVAPTGTGKSSTVYALVHRHGARALSDEMALVDVEERHVEVGSPMLRLAREPDDVPEAVESGIIHPTVSKRWYRLGAEYLPSRGAPLEGIVQLRSRSSSDSEAWSWRELRGGQALTSILDQSFDLESSPPEWRRGRFRALSRLARTSPIYRATYARDPRGEPTHVDRLVDAMERTT